MPALRDLRAVAKVYRFEKPDVGRLTSRLMEIATSVRYIVICSMETRLLICCFIIYNFRKD